MKKKKDETNGRSPKKHAPIPATFNDVLGAVGHSDYKDEKIIKKKEKPKKKT